MSDEQTTAQDLLATLRAKYLDNLPERFGEIEQLVLEMERQEDPEAASEVYRKIHSLKGSAGTYGAMILSNICHQLEDYLAGVSTPQLDRQQTSLVLGYIGLLRDALASVLAGDQSFPDVERELQRLRQSAFAAPYTALIVIPSRAVRQVVLSSLGGLPLKPVVVDDGLTALQRLLHEPFDLLITGLKVPELPGPALISALRLSDGPNRDLRTLLVTSSGSELSLPEVARPDLVVAVDPQLSALGGKVSTLLGISS